MATRPNIDSETRLRILLICDSADFDEGGAGRAAWESAAVLSDYYDVILAVPEVSQASTPRFAVVYYNRRNLGLLIRDSDVAILTHKALAENPFVLEAGQPLYEIGDLSVIAERSLRNGKIDGKPLDVDNLVMPDAIAGGELLAIKPEFRETPKSLAHYLERFRHHLRQGGFRQAAGRGSALARRKIQGKKGK